jgi:predicted acyl esterase
MTSIRRSIGLLAAFLICHASAAQEKYAAPSAAEYEVEEVNEIRIPMKDGVQLSASLFMPKARKPGERFPVLLHTTPYR